jgi:hypothetical protein
MDEARELDRIFGDRAVELAFVTRDDLNQKRGQEKGSVRDN